MPVSMTIPDVPDDVAEELARRASRAGQPLPEYLLRQLVALAQHPSPDSFWDDVQRRVVVTDSRLSGEAILELRDADLS
ncbi:hypothetical protein E9529_18425 [Blastococcus sp. KM273128]|uniref:hypothetical protein n=1 Tax=Blastococcus sp. KM273128 TaxID=2570314 RepID=UPI001F2BCE36|nr:hypothetical protein [Blastococcus sp. KM273128]MCF6746212.1 hypothetical protein [Blastococcus sp. KM273128]